MPRYFFDIHDGIQVTDDLGQDLSDLDSARAEALRIASGFATRPDMLDDEGGALTIVVRNAPDVTVMTIRLVFDIEIPKGPSRS